MKIEKTISTVYKTVYVSDDGKTFDTERDCERYEAGASVRRFRKLLREADMDDCVKYWDWDDYSGVKGYISAGSDNALYFVKVTEEIAELCKELCEHTVEVGVIAIIEDNEYCDEFYFCGTLDSIIEAMAKDIENLARFRKEHM